MLAVRERMRLPVRARKQLELMQKAVVWLANRSLRAKIVMILSAVVIAYAAFDLLVQRFVIYESFLALERQAAR